MWTGDESLTIFVFLSRTAFRQYYEVDVSGKCKEPAPLVWMEGCNGEFVKNYQHRARRLLGVLSELPAGLRILGERFVLATKPLQR